jgi:hypothetical protein
VLNYWRSILACGSTALVLALVAGSAAAADSTVVGVADAKFAEPITKGQRVFSTGHSYHFGFPPILDRMAHAAGIEGSAIVGVSSIGGSRAVQHAASEAVQSALKAGNVDVLMTTPIYLPDPGIEQLAQLGFEHNPQFRLTMMEFWLPFDNYEPRNYTHGPKGSPTEHIDPPKTDHNTLSVETLKTIHRRYFDEMDEHVTTINKKFPQQVVFVVPVGQAVIALREKIVAGEAFQLKAQSDLFTDPLGHPAKPLTILMAYCHHAVIYRRSPIGLPVPAELGSGSQVEETNRLLQTLAWDAVTHHPLSGVLIEPK